MTRAQRAGAVRSDVTPDDVIAPSCKTSA
ncbi:hypothetical protein [Arthrobacter sp. KNU40]